MLARNYAKPFCIAGFILAEIYMLFVVLAPYGHHPQALPFPPLDDTTLPAFSPVPTSYMIERVLVSSIFFGPFGALVGLGVGLLFSGALQWWRNRQAGQK